MIADYPGAIVEDIVRQVAWDDADWLSKGFFCIIFIVGPLILIGFVAMMLAIWAL